MIIVGLTGGIASGKSTVAAELAELGVPVFDADAASRAAVSKGSRGLELVEKALGGGYISASGELDRAKVAALVFKDEKARRSLEVIIHKIVRERAKKFLNDCREEGAVLAVLDVPLLIESGWYREVDRVWLVAADPRQQLVRAMQRGGISRQDAEARMAAQMPLQEKRRYADLILDNSGSVEATLAQVRREVENILSAASDGQRKK